MMKRDEMCLYLDARKMDSIIVKGDCLSLFIQLLYQFVTKNRQTAFKCAGHQRLVPNDASLTTQLAAMFQKKVTVLLVYGNYLWLQCYENESLFRKRNIL